MGGCLCIPFTKLCSGKSEESINRENAFPHFGIVSRPPGQNLIGNNVVPPIITASQNNHQGPSGPNIHSNNSFSRTNAVPRVEAVNNKVSVSATLEKNRKKELSRTVPTGVKIPQIDKTKREKEVAQNITHRLRDTSSQPRDNSSASTKRVVQWNSRTKRSNLDNIVSGIGSSNPHHSSSFKHEIISPTNVQRRKYDPNYYPAASEISASSSTIYRILYVPPFKSRDIKRSITNKHIIIHSIEKIENKYLEASYHIKKKQKLKDFTNIDELELFHGTKSVHVDSICKNNFNWRFCGSNTGHQFGRGVYFSCNAMYAAYYSSDDYEKVLFIAKVLVGNKCLGTQNMKLPEKGYDTSAKNHSNIVIVKYEDNEYYPLYKIKFHISPDYILKNKRR